MATWKVEKTSSEKFPYRISIQEGQVETLSLYAQDKWPGQKGNIFCLRQHDEISELGETVETCEIVSLRRFGRKLSLVLDRSNKKRCEFLFLEKHYKNKAGTYEQIFFRTQTGIKQHRSKGKLNLYGQATSLQIIVESNERYPWSFTGHQVSRKPLAAGDYALLLENQIAAVVERKTFENMLSDVANLQILHQQLAELSLYPHAALVIEAQYGDFLNPDKIKPWTMAHLSRVFAELSALHERLPIIYAGNRKEANQWSLRYFEAIAKKTTDKTIAPIAQVISSARVKAVDSPLWLVVERAVKEMPSTFKTADIQYQCPTLKSTQINAQLTKLKESGRLTKEGKGRGLKWIKLTDSTE